MKVSLPAPAIQVACGDNHTAVLLETGKVYTFGRYQEGQLGRQRGQDEGDNWHMLPGQVSLRESLKPVSIAARSNQTFINVDESLVTEGIISRCKAFANSHHLGELGERSLLRGPGVHSYIPLSSHPHPYQFPLIPTHHPHLPLSPPPPPIP